MSDMSCSGILTPHSSSVRASDAAKPICSYRSRSPGTQAVTVSRFRPRARASSAACSISMWVRPCPCHSSSTAISITRISCCAHLAPLDTARMPPGNAPGLMKRVSRLAPLLSRLRSVSASSPGHSSTATAAGVPSSSAIRQVQPAHRHAPTIIRSIASTRPSGDAPLFAPCLAAAHIGCSDSALACVSIAAIVHSSSRVARLISIILPHPSRLSPALWRPAVSVPDRPPP